MSYASLKTLRPFFTNKCGRLLAGGKVYTYEVGTLTPKATYKDAAGLTENTNPIVLDVSGEADIYINSDYRFQIFDKDGVLIDDVDSVAPTQRISSAFLIDESGFNQAQINATKEDTLNKGVAGGYPSLDENAKIPVDQLPMLLMFASNLSASGYQEIPNPVEPTKPFILQWMIGVSNANGDLLLSNPAPFQVGPIGGMANESNPSGWTSDNTSVWAFDLAGSSKTQSLARVRNIIGTGGPTIASGISGRILVWGC